jgi:predicted RNase H-like HicB family nuclease
MKYQAIIKKTDAWWIGWLIDLTGVNAQEKTREELIESLRIGAEEMLTIDIPFQPDSEMILINVGEQIGEENHIPAYDAPAKNL